jgi:prepilin-type processing-associated H-X9-DG protein
VIKTLLCPSDGGDKTIAPGSFHYSPDGTVGKVTAIKTNYDFIAQAQGVNRYNWWRNTTLSTRYIFGENSETTLPDISDGTTNTLLMGEQTLDLYNGVTSSWAYAGWVSVGIDPVGNWNVTYPAQGLNVWNYNNVSNQYGKRASWYTAASLHTGGVNFVMADGSVRFIQESIDLPNLTRLCRMADGDVITINFQ